MDRAHSVKKHAKDCSQGRLKWLKKYIELSQIISLKGTVLFTSGIWYYVPKALKKVEAV